MPWFDPTGISSLDQCHGDTHEEEHLTLLHAAKIEEYRSTFEGVKVASFWLNRFKSIGV